MFQMENLPLMAKIALVEKCTGPKALFDYLIQLLGQFPYHSFLAKIMAKGTARFSSRKHSS